jgi:hypothetical protein
MGVNVMVSYLTYDAACFATVTRPLCPFVQRRSEAAL